MSRHGARPGFEPEERPCALAWCTTPHGATLHERDEDHRSAGQPVTVELRTGGSPAPLVFDTAEVGLLRRVSDDRTWLVVEDGGRIHLEITIASARAFLAALAADPTVARELDLEVQPG